MRLLLLKFVCLWTCICSAEQQYNYTDLQSESELDHNDHDMSYSIKSSKYFVQANTGILTGPSECGQHTDDQRINLGSDGLMCWDGAWANSAKNPTIFYMYCPVIVNQIILDKTAKAYIGTDGKVERFDYTDCGFQLDDLSAEEKTVLKDVTAELKMTQLLCSSGANIATEFSLKNGHHEQVPSFHFDNVACGAIQQNLDGTGQENSSGEEDIYLFCSKESKYMEGPGFDLYSQDRLLNASLDEGQTTEAGHSIGWFCLKDSVRQLLKRTTLDQFFKPGCAAFSDDDLSMPHTSAGNQFEVKCKKFDKYDFIDESHVVSFKCNSYSQWEGSRNLEDRPECQSKEVKTLLDVMSRTGCSDQFDGIYKWHTDHPGTIRERCPRHILGHDTQSDLYEEDSCYGGICGMKTYRNTYATRVCTGESKWLPADYRACVRALPEQMKGLFQPLQESYRHETS